VKVSVCKFYPSQPGIYKINLLKTNKQLKLFVWLLVTCMIRVEIGNIFANSLVYFSLNLQRLEYFIWFLTRSEDLQNFTS